MKQLFAAAAATFALSAAVPAMAGHHEEAASDTAVAATTAAQSANTEAPRYVRGEVLQTTPAATKANGEYPICQGEVQDGCINPRAAGKNWGNRPLDYWPGKPASEIPGKKPANKPS